MTDRHPILEALQPYVQPDRVADFARYFQTFEGGYAHGDIFIGVMVPDRRKVAREYALIWSEEVLASGFVHPIHEVRHTAIVAAMFLFTKERKRREHWHTFFTQNVEGINNWDLVDTCAHKVFGRYACEFEDFTTLERMLDSESIWQKRIAIVANLWMLKLGRYDELLAYAPIAAEGAPEILQKAVGWLLKCLWQQQPALAEEHMAVFLQNGTYSKLIVRIGLEKASKAHRADFIANFAP